MAACLVSAGGGVVGKGIRAFVFVAVAVAAATAQARSNRDLGTPTPDQPAYEWVGNTRYEVLADATAWRPVVFEQKDFDRVERWVAQHLKDQSDELESIHLSQMYDWLGEAQTPAQFRKHAAVLEEWINKHPRSHVPYVVRGSLHIKWAWAYRGSDWAANVKADAWPKFEEHLRLAKQDLEHAYQLNRRDPNAPSLQLSVAMGQGADPDTIERLYQQAITACPHHNSARHRKLMYLTPKWGGSVEQMMAFGFECHEASKHHPMLATPFVSAYDELRRIAKRSGQDVRQVDEQFWPRVNRVYRAILARYPENPRMRFYYAYFADKNYQIDTALEQFEKIGNRWARNTIWSSIDYFHGRRAGIHFEMANEHHHRNEHGLSEQRLIQGLALAPNSASACLSMCWIQASIHRDAQKVRHYAQRALSSNPTAQERATAMRFINMVDQMP